MPDGRGMLIVMHSEFSLPCAALLALLIVKLKVAHA